MKIVGEIITAKIVGEIITQGRGGKVEQQFPGKLRLPGENLFERKLNRGNRMLKKKKISC